jgi:TonB family protein
MKKLIIASLAIALGSAAGAQPAGSFQRPDCSAFKDRPEPEATCFRKNKLAVRYANYEALQKTGLEFVYLARPVDGKELEDSYPEVIKAGKDKVEGEFLINFSVNTNGDVYDVKIVEASSEPNRARAKVWADAIAQWKFVKIARPVTDVPFRRIYLFSSEDDQRGRKSGG